MGAVGPGLPPPRPQNPGPGRSAALPQGSQGVPPPSAARGRNTGRAGQRGTGPPEGCQGLLRQFWGTGKGVKAHARASGHSRASQCWNRGGGPAPPQPLESQPSECLQVRGGDGGGDEGGGGGGGSYRKPGGEGQAPPSPGRHLGCACEST